jgi:FkbM family methyltransferase
MFLDSTDEAMCPRLSQQKVWEPDTTKLVEKLLKKDDVVLDIGANIGYYTLIFARLAKEVFAVEPDPYTFKLLKKNVASNNYKNVELFQAAVTNYTGNCKLYLSNKNRSNNRIYDANENSRVLTVPTIKLDDYFKGKIDFIKIDVEGAEGMVMSGALNILQNNPDLKIFSEFYPKALAMNAVNAEGYLKILEDQGFKFYDVNLNKATTKSELLKNYPADSEKITNILCEK